MDEVDNSVVETVVVEAVATWAVHRAVLAGHLDNPASDCEDDAAAVPSGCLAR